MSLIKRIEKVEAARPNKTACFVVANGRANGRAWWRDDLTWENLTRPEFTQLAAEMEADGVKVLKVNIHNVKPTGERVTSWEVVNHQETH